MSSGSVEQESEIAISSNFSPCMQILVNPIRLRIVQLLMSGSQSLEQLARECGIDLELALEHVTAMREQGFLDEDVAGRASSWKMTRAHLTRILNCIEVGLTNSVVEG